MIRRCRRRRRLTDDDASNQSPHRAFHRSIDRSKERRRRARGRRRASPSATHAFFHASLCPRPEVTRRDVCLFTVHDSPRPSTGVAHGLALTDGVGWDGCRFDSQGWRRGRVVDDIYNTHIAFTRIEYGDGERLHTRDTYSPSNQCP